MENDRVTVTGAPSGRQRQQQEGRGWAQNVRRRDVNVGPVCRKGRRDTADASLQLHK